MFGRLKWIMWWAIKIYLFLFVYLHCMSSVSYWFFVYFGFTVKVNKDTGKTDIILTKEKPEQQWPSLGKHLEKHNRHVKVKDQGKQQQQQLQM